MADVFLSYAREDVERAEHLAEALEDRGLSVWWDREIAPGKAFDEVIEEEIATAKCVVVLWSHISVRSGWVRTEASDAADRGVLVPVILDPLARIPLAFRRIHAADLSDWPGRGHRHVQMEELSEAIAALVGTPPGSAASDGRVPREMGPGSVPAPHPGALLPDTSMSRLELTLSMVVGLLPIGVGGWLSGPMVFPDSPGWLVRTSVWLFGGLCFAAVVTLLEGVSTRPTGVGMYARSRERSLRWVAAASLIAVVAVPLLIAALT